MADTKLTALTALTSVSDDDLLYVADEPGGSPVSKKITIANLFNSWFSLTDLSKPSGVSFSWVNQGGASVSTLNGNIILTVPSSASQSIRIREITAPSTPYTITALFIPTFYSTNYQFINFGFRDNSDGKLHSMRYGFLNGSYISTVTSSSPTADVAAFSEMTSFICPGYLFLQLTDNGTNFIFKYSSDGVSFVELYTVGRTSYLSTPDKVFWGGDSRNSHEFYVALCHWEQT